MNDILDTAMTLISDLGYSASLRAQVFIVFALSILVPVIALACIYVRDRQTWSGKTNT